MAQDLAQLDRMLLRRGQDLFLRRRVKNTNPSVNIDLPCRGTIRGYEPHELTAGIVQGDRKVILSPSALNVDASKWPGAAGGDSLPVVGDYVVYRGRQFYIQAIDLIEVNGELTRINAQVRG